MYALCGAGALSAQGKSVAVPFVGCKSDGQLEPREAPKGRSVNVAIGADDARQLAYYRAPESVVGVLAPRGWYCFGTYGSGGDDLSVVPQPVDTNNILSNAGHGFAGPVIHVSHSDGETVGRFSVAEVIARVFPAYKEFAIGVQEETRPAGSFPFGPYPKDKLTYKSKRVVEYRTPAQTDGLATHSWLMKNDRPIEGVAILFGPTPDLLLVSVRLPSELSRLAPAIVGQVERDAARAK